MRNCRLKISLVSALFIAFLPNGFAQFVWAEIGVNGLTCSQCSRSVEMSLLKLDFVEQVQMNLEHTNGKIIFKKNHASDLKKIAKAVTDAGFSMRYLKAAWVFSNLKTSSCFILTDAGNTYCLLNTGDKTLNGETVVNAVSKEFLPRPDYTAWKAAIVKSCGEIKKEVIYLAL